MDIAQRWMSLPHEWQPLFERWAEDPKKTGWRFIPGHNTEVRRLWG